MSVPIVKLKEIAEFVNGKAFKPTDWSEKGIPIIRIQNLNSLYKPYNYWAGPLDKEVHVKRNDLLLAWSGTPGTSFGAHIWGGGAAVLNQHIFRVDLKESLVTKEWAKFVINAQLSTLIGMAHGGVGLQHVTKGMVEGLEIPLPPLLEQRRIAAILDQADALRAKRREALAKLDSLTQSIFIEMFGDPILNPMNWPCKTLKALGRVKTGGTPPSAKDGMFGGTIPFVTPGDLGSNEPAKRTVTELGAAAAETIRSGAALVCCIGATIGKMAKAKHRSAFNQQINAVEWGSEIDDDYGINVLTFFKSTIAGQGASTTLPILKKSSFEKIIIPAPPIVLQNEFSKRVVAVENLKSGHRAMLLELDTLFASLQHRAFRGEL